MKVNGAFLYSIIFFSYVKHEVIYVPTYAYYV